MRKLEARYYPPLAAAGTYIVVGHVVADVGETTTLPRVEAAPSLGRHGSPAAILATLRHLVATTAPRSLERLASLRSQYWSFVSVGDDASRMQDA